eukprot:SAG11_NODE_2474_length_3317_cov_2.656930_2_plen_133_part_00
MDCGFDVENRESLEISGTDGTVRVDGFVLVSTPPGRTPSRDVAHANSFEVSTGQDRSIDGLPSGNRTTTFETNRTEGVAMPFSQEAEMIREFSRLVASGEDGSKWAQFLLKTQRVIDAVHESLKLGGAPVDV